MTLMHRTTLMAYMVSALILARPADMILDVINIDSSSIDNAAFSRGLNPADCMLKSGLCAAGPFVAEQMPSNSDIIFDCIRVTWVAMIICILFFEMNLASALWTGIITGLAYTLFVRAMYQSQLDVLHREQAMRQGRMQAAGAQTAADGASPTTPLNPQPQQQQQQHPYVIVV